MPLRSMPWATTTATSPPTVPVLHGGVFEVGRRFFEKRFQKVRFSDSRSVATGIAAAYYETAPEVLAPLRVVPLPPSPPFVGSRPRRPVLPRPTARRLGRGQPAGPGRAAGIEQLMLANSWPAISLLTSGSLAQRRSAMTQMRAAERLLPGVTTVVPINPPTIGKRLRVTARTVGRRVPAAVRLMKATRRRLNRRACLGPSLVRPRRSRSFLSDLCTWRVRNSDEERGGAVLLWSPPDREAGPVRPARTGGCRLAERERALTPPYGGVFVPRTRVMDADDVQRADQADGPRDHRAQPRARRAWC